MVHVIPEREHPASSAASRGPLVYTRCSFCFCCFVVGWTSRLEDTSNILSAALSVCCDPECGQARMRTDSSITLRRTSFLQERVTTAQKESITLLQAVYVPADDLTDPIPETTFAHLDATTLLSRQIFELGIHPTGDPLNSTS